MPRIHRILYIQILPELRICMQDVMLHMDVVTVSNRKFIATIGQPLFYRDAVPIDNKSEEIFAVIDMLLLFI